MNLPPLPKPNLFDGVKLDIKGKYAGTTNGYTADQVRQAQRDAVTAAVPEWQPIETAPISDAINPNYRVMMWISRAGLAFGYVYGDGDGGIMTSPDGYSGSGWKVTHWMPLPAPPKSACEQKEKSE